MGVGTHLLYYVELEWLSSSGGYSYIVTKEFLDYVERFLLF